MKRFCEVFRYYLKRQGISVADISLYTGIDRSTLYQFQNDKRIPSGLQVIDQIADCLKLDGEERRQLQDSYYVSKEGEYAFAARRQITKMICNALKRDPLDQDRLLKMNYENMTAQTGGQTIFSGRLNVDAIIAQLLLHGPAENEVCISELVPDDYTLRVLSEAYRNFPEKRIRHVILLDDTEVVSEWEDIYNFKILEKLLRYMLLNENYRCGYFYGNVQTFRKSGQFFCNLIMMDQLAFAYSQDHEYGLLIREKDIAETYRKMQNQYILKAAQFVTRIDYKNYLPHFENLFPGSGRHEPIYIMDPSLCLVWVFDPEKDLPLLQGTSGIVSEEDFENIQDFFNHCKVFRAERKEKKDRLRLIFTKQGIDYFCSTGRLPVLYISDKYVLPESIRITFLKRWKQIIKCHEVRMVDIKDYPGDSVLCIMQKPEETLLDIPTREGVPCCVQIREASITLNMYNYLTDLYEHQCMSREDTIRYLEEKIAVLENE